MSPAWDRGLRMVVKEALAIGLVLLLSACGSLPPENFAPASRIAVRRVCLTSPGIPDRPQVTIMNPIGAGFGVLGNIIEARRAAGAQQEMQAVLAKANYNYGSALTDSVFLAMGKAGFTMLRSPDLRPEKERGRFLVCFPQMKRVDAYLDVYADYVGIQALQSSEEDAVLVRAEDNYRFRDRAALQANPSRTARALENAIEAVAWELAKQFM